MTTTALPVNAAPQRGVELLVSRVAVGMLRWSQQRSARQRVTHEEMVMLRHIERETATATDLARLNRLN